MPERLRHEPVLHSREESEVMRLLSPKPGDMVLDATLGLGGHALGFLERIGSGGRLTGLDLDQENLSVARDRLSAFSKQIDVRHGNFRDLRDLPQFDIILADLGLSSPHLDDASRGFSFRTDAPLDLRFDRTRGRTAAEFLERASADEITRVFQQYGEFSGAHKLSHALKKGPRVSQTTRELKALAEEVFGYRAQALLPQIFQALRMRVNDEPGALADFLEEAPYKLNVGGRLGIISYHSLEDRAVKTAFRTLSQPVIDPATGRTLQNAAFTLLTKRPVRPSEREIKRNPRSRSALFRVLRRTAS
ncbi:MAG: 16S rRNA (cytosine(1402)-N(4))-methyltransferase RsmH [Patescibacteria group bacterium]